MRCHWQGVACCPGSRGRGRLLRQSSFCGFGTTPGHPFCACRPPGAISAFCDLAGRRGGRGASIVTPRRAPDVSCCLLAGGGASIVTLRRAPGVSCYLLAGGSASIATRARGRSARTAAPPPGSPREVYQLQTQLAGNVASRAFFPKERGGVDRGCGAIGKVSLAARARAGVGGCCGKVRFAALAPPLGTPSAPAAPRAPFPHSATLRGVAAAAVRVL